MNWAYVIDPSARKDLGRIPKKDTVRILDAIDGMQNDPYRGDLTKLDGIAWRRRIGNYRIKFTLDQEMRVIEVYEIERRTSTTYRYR